jgi:beta-N-acetylhexosaminidase
LIAAVGGPVGQTLPAGGASAPSTAGADEALRRDVGQLIVLGFAGQSAPAYLRALLRQRRAAGVILFRANIRSASQLRALTRALQRSGHDEVLVSADQEGGEVRRLPWVGPFAGQPAQRTPRRANREATAAGRGLHRAGVNLNLAPVADVAAGRRSAMRARAFPGGSASVAASTAAAVRGYRAAATGATAKHFPGLGRAQANTDQRAVTITASRRSLERRDVQPFRAAIAAGVPAVMVSHALYTAYDPHRIASQSPALVRGLLRRRLRFGGVIVTDSLEASAVLARSSVETAARRSVTAGADLLLLTGPASYRRVYQRLLAVAVRSPRFRGRVAEAASRVRALKRGLGLRVLAAP